MAYVLPSTNADLNTTWDFLVEGIDQIMTKLHMGVTYSKYMSMYNAAHSYCTASRMGFDAHGSGKDLYNNLGNYFSTHLTTSLGKVALLEKEELLAFYSKEWTRYTTGAKYVNQLFMYLNRHWVTRERAGGWKNVYTIYTLALAQWRDWLFKKTQSKPSKLIATILELIDKQRDGETIDQGLIRSVLESFVSLGIDDNDPDKPCLNVYRGHFEAAFIDATKAYYRHDSELFLADHNISDYLTRIEEIIKEEEDHIDRYLHSQTRKILISTCEQVLIQERLQSLWDGFRVLLKNDKETDLRRMWVLLSRTDSPEPLRQIFEEHVKDTGLAVVSALIGEGGVDEIDPKLYVEVLLEVHRKNYETTLKCFNAEMGFVTSLDKGCREFINRNAATRLSSSKSPELIAKHTDLLLRKNSKVAEQSDIESELNRVMILFKYVEDKDVFQTFYTTKLSKRLVHNISASEESEASMISKLKEECGFEYTTKLQRMFTDVNLSQDLTDQFRERMLQTHGDSDIAFSAMVLGTNIWPLSPPGHSFVIQPELQTTYNRFRGYYQAKHSGRKLTWLWNYSKNELKTNYLNQKYIFMTSAYQTAVLLQYNRHDTLTLSELLTATSIPKELLLQVLGLLTKGKVLVDGGTGEYSLNPKYKSKKVKVNLNQPIKAESKIESRDVLRTVDEDRKYSIQATIVRIMKARKTMNHQQLVQEIIGQISQRFTPKIPDIKRAIETLLEKEYLERGEGMYTYVA
ncbi:hypothetical protein AX15_000191 [Amanita polypyramis BW_CC]|nr:hypothetical protein AX15_000191 [Amanita polypyramis BW_CC]